MVVWAAHFGGNGVGTKVYFVDGSNVKVERTIVAQRTYDGDLKLSILDSDVPANIAKYPVLPDLDATTYIGSGGWSNPNGGPAAIYIDGNDPGPEDVFYCTYCNDYPQQSAAWTANGNTYDRSASFVNHEDPHIPTDMLPYAGYSKLPFGGDSGSPAFMVEGGRLIYITSWFGATSGPSLQNQKAFLDDAFTDLYADAGAGVPSGADLATVATLGTYTTFP